MAGPYRAIPAGNDWLAATLKSIKSQLSAQQTAAPIRNSRISNPDGLTVGAVGSGTQIQLLTEPNGGLPFGVMLFYDASDPDTAADITSDGENFLRLTSPENSADNPSTTGAILTLNRGNGSGVGASLVLQPAGYNSLIGAYGAGVVTTGSGSNAAHATVGAFDFFGDVTSSRIMGNSSLVFPVATAEIRCRDFADSAYVPIRASAFTVSSTREAKQDIRDLGWSLAKVIRDAPAYRWRYLPEHADPDRVHFGPMAEDLPPELVDHGDPDVPGVNQADLLGVAWAALGEAFELIDALTERVRILEGVKSQP